MDVNFSACASEATPQPASLRGGITSGYTLIELLVTLAVAAVLLGVAVPSFSAFIAANRQTVQINELVTALNVARSAAIRRGNDVVLCKSPNGDKCDRHAAWQDGWLLFVDTDRDRIRGTGEDVIGIHPPFEGHNTISFRGFRSSNYVVYYPTGLARDNGTFRFCDDRGPEAAKAIILSKTGRPRLSRKMASGKPIPCP